MARVRNDVPDQHNDVDVHLYGHRQLVVTINRNGVCVARITLPVSPTAALPAEILISHPKPEQVQ